MPPTATAADLQAYPLAATLRRVQAATELPALRFRTPAAESLTGDQLAGDPAAIAAAIDLTAAGIEAEYGQRPRRYVAATWALHRYTWIACLLMSGPFLLDRRVPLLDPADIGVDPATGTVEVAPAPLACLPGDPLAAHRSDPYPVTAHPVTACPVGDLDALRGALRRAVASHLRPVLSAFAPHTRCGPHALWGAVTDQLVSSLCQLGQGLGQQERGIAEAQALLPGGTPPYVGTAALRPLRLPDGRTEFTRTRAHCCLYYTLRPDDACLTCPRTHDAERIRRLSDKGGA